MSDYLNKRKSRLKRAKDVGVLCFLGRFYCPEKCKQALYSTAKGVPSGWVGLAPFGESEVAVDWVPEGTDGAVRVEPGPGEHTCEFHFGTVLAEWPQLAVEPGMALEIPFRVRRGRMILSPWENEYRHSEPYEQKVRKWQREARADDGDPADHS